MAVDSANLLIKVEDDLLICKCKRAQNKSENPDMELITEYWMLMGARRVLTELLDEIYQKKLF